MPRNLELALPTRGRSPETRRLLALESGVHAQNRNLPYPIMTWHVYHSGAEHASVALSTSCLGKPDAQNADLNHLWQWIASEKGAGWLLQEEGTTFTGCIYKGYDGTTTSSTQSMDTRSNCAHISNMLQPYVNHCHPIQSHSFVQAHANPT